MMSFLEIDRIKKRFGPVVALEEVTLQVEPGEIHALLGENGAGKTTLMNILYGLLRADSGTLVFEGKDYRPQSPQDAMKCGVGMVHQHFMLVPTLTVLENLYLGNSPFGRYDPVGMVQDLSEKLRDTSFDFPLDAKVETLSVGERQQIEIFRALWKGARLLILDEPTAVLAPQQVQDLFGLLRDLRSKGHSILFISHKLDEIQELCDRVTLLRRGRTLGTYRTSEIDRTALARLLLGEEGAFSFSRSRKPEPPRTTPFLIRTHPDSTGKLRKEWCCPIYPGRITGVAGVEGNGQRELAEAILGLSSTDSVLIEKDGEQLPEDPGGRIRSGVGLISEDRQHTGLVMEFSVMENLVLKDVDQAPWSRRGFLNKRAILRSAEEWIRRYDIRPPDPYRRAADLSGGNQQKIVVARELSRRHRLLVAFNPTRGLDLGARTSVHRALAKDAESGSAILLISTELEEILELADRLMVLFQGDLREMPAGTWSAETIGLAMLGQLGETIE